MGKQSRHPKPRFLRVAAILAWALHGLIMPWTATPLEAANPDSLTLSVRAISLTAPAPVSDLLASPNPAVPGVIGLTWTAPQGNAGGTPIPNLIVASYTVHYATFSVVSLSGNTTSWWNATTANETTLAPPGYTLQAPGSLEAYSFSGLTPGGTYYFAIRSTSPGGIVSSIDTLAGLPGQQAFAVAARPPSGSANAPMMPNGILSTSIGNGLQVQIDWTPVARDTGGNGVAVDHYVLYTYSAIGSSATSTISLPSTASSYTENTGGATRYYRLQAVTAVGNSSALSDYVDSSSEANRYAIASDDVATRVVMPHDAARYLLAANNPYGQDLQVVITHQPQDETNVTLRSYRAVAVIASTGETLTQFSFPQNNIAIQLGYGAILGSPNGPLSINAKAPLDAQALASILSVYWFNGSSFVRVGSPILVAGNAVSVSVRNLGTYQIRAVTIGNAFRLTQGSPYPRVITPNGAENRRVFWFFDNPTGDTVEGTIYDIRGAKVRTLQVDSLSPTPNSLVWDGRDSHGAVVPSGIYLYKIATSEKTVTGTVVVAR
jgi:hypothetical protein